MSAEPVGDSAWTILRDLLTAEVDRLASKQDDPQTGQWFSGMRHAFSGALAYMDGIDEGRQSSPAEDGDATTR